MKNHTRVTDKLDSRRNDQTRCRPLQLADRQMGMGRAAEGFEILSARPPPWSVEEQAACFVVRDNDGQFTGVAYASSI
jgi:hypothetical protein